MKTSGVVNANGFEIGSTDAPAFGACENHFDLYLDEQWPETFRTPRSNEAIITVLAVHRSALASLNRDLPDCPNHCLRTLGLEPSVSRVRALLKCNSIFPFIVRLDTDRPSPKTRREEILRAALEVTVGWQLSLKRSAGGTLNIYVDQDHGMDYGDTANHKATFRAICEDSSRLRNWKITKATSQSAASSKLLSYCDLLIRSVAGQESKLACQFADVVRGETLPGYVRLSTVDVRALRDSEPLTRETAATAILDLCGSQSLGQFGTIILDHLGEKGCHNASFQRRMFEELERRYKDKNRKLSLLNRQYQGMRKYFVKLPPKPPRRLRLLLAALEFQYANHLGRPEDVGDVASVYRGVWRDLLAEDSDLASSVSAKLAIHYCDRFEFEKALAFLNEVITDSTFAGVSRRSKGVLYSTRGQVASMLKSYARAESDFESALSILAEIDDDRRDGELRQTTIYRLINRLDGRIEDPKSNVADLFGLFRNAALRLVRSGAPVDSWDHHVFLRSLFQLSKKRDAEISAAIEAYLSVPEAEWATGDVHPWELIEMYRGLLLYKCYEGDDVAARSRRCFDRAAAIAAVGSHGITLRLIRAMVQCVGVLASEEVNDQRTFAAGARSDIQIVTKTLPRNPFVSGVVEVLEAAISSPSMFTIDRVLEVLPFNYH